ncbi:MAG: class B sortase [Ruminococcus flavefaciens]|nr:class B sortase [Ruminococcus flavefaciens]
MKDNLNDVIPESTQDKNDKLNEILNSVDSKLQPESNVSSWEDELTSVIEKRSHKSDIEEILSEISSEPEKEISAPEVADEEFQQNDVQELVSQITVGKKVSELSEQKKMLAEENEKPSETLEEVTENTKTAEESDNTVDTVQEVTEEPAVQENPEVHSETPTTEDVSGQEKAQTLVYNVPRRKAPESVVRATVASTPVAQVRKPVKKIVRVDKAKSSEPHKPEQPVKRNIPEQARVNMRNEKNIPKQKKKKSVKEKFIDLFPQKQDPALEKVRKVVFMCSICAIVVCGYMVGDYYIDLGKSKSLHDEIESIYEPYNPPVQAQNVATIYEPDYERTYTMLDGAKKLLDMNPDVVGYITIPNTPVANPVMQSGDNSKYLDQNINGDSSRAGELFLDYRNNFDRVVDGKLSVANSDNLVIYGHNMKNDEMFGSLKYYQRNYNYYNDNPVIYLNSNYECYTYKIFSYFILDALDESETAYDCWNKFDFDDEEDFYNFVNEAKKRSLGLNDVDVKYGDKLLTLSTCNTILGDRGRLIVMGRLLRDGEDARQGTEKNVQNANVKWPSIYYQQKPNEKYNPDAEFIPYGPNEEE